MEVSKQEVSQVILLFLRCHKEYFAFAGLLVVQAVLV